MVVSFAAGGPTDTVARVMSAKVSELLGQQFVVEKQDGRRRQHWRRRRRKVGARRLHPVDVDGGLTHAINPGLWR